MTRGECGRLTGLPDAKAVGVDIGWPEVLIVVLVVLLLFGGRKLPEIARGTGRALRIFKAETKGLMDHDSDDDTTASKDAPPAQLASPPPPTEPYAAQPYQQPYQQAPAQQPYQQAPAPQPYQQPYQQGPAQQAPAQPYPQTPPAPVDEASAGSGGTDTER